MPDKIKILYDAVSKDYSVGSFEEFASKLQDETKRRAFYDGVGAEYNLGDYDTFTSKVKKNSGQNGSGNGLPSSASGLGTSQYFQKPTSKAPLIYTPEKQAEFIEENKNYEAPKPEKIKFNGLIKDLSAFNKGKKQLQDFADPRLDPVWQEIHSKAQPRDFVYNAIKTTLDTAGDLVPDRVKNAWERGKIQGEIANIIPIMSRPDADKEAIANDIATYTRLSQQIPESEESKQLNEKGVVWAFKNPVEGAKALGEVIISSLSSQLKAAERTTPLSVGAGAAMGSAIPGVGTTVGAVSGFTAGQILAGMNVESSATFLDVIKEAGFPVNDEKKLAEAFQDKKLIDKARSMGIKRGLPIAIFDLLTAGIAGKVGASQALGKVAKIGAVAGIETAGGSAGEFAAQVTSGQDIDANAIALEGIAELGSGAPAALSETAATVVDRKKTSSSNENIIKQIATDKETGVVEAKQNLDRNLEDGLISPEDHAEGIEVVEKIIAVDEKIPAKVEGESREKAIELISKREDVTEELKSLEEEKKVIDEAFHEPIDGKIERRKAKIEEINAEIKEASKAKPVEEVKAEPVVEKADYIDDRLTDKDFDSEGDLTDEGFDKVTTKLKSAIQTVSETLGVPINPLLKHYNINSKGEYFSGQTPILEIGKSQPFVKMIKTIKNIAFEMFPDKIDELNEQINKHSDELLNALENDDKTFVANKSIGKVLTALQEIDKLFTSSIEQNAPTTNEQETITEETQAEVKEVVADKAVELQSKPNATDKVLKEQKKDMLTQLNEVKDIVFGKRTEPDLIPETIAKVRDLGYEINDAGQVTFEVKDDGIFKIHADNLADAISEVKKGFPETTDTENKVKMPGKGRVSERAKAESRGSLQANELNLNNAKENLQTAIKSGNKKLQAVFEKEVEREQKIYDEAKRIGLPEKSIALGMNTDKNTSSDIGVEEKRSEIYGYDKLKGIEKDGGYIKTDETITDNDYEPDDVEYERTKAYKVEYLVDWADIETSTDPDREVFSTIDEAYEDSQQPGDFWNGNIDHSKRITPVLKEVWLSKDGEEYEETGEILTSDDIRNDKVLSEKLGFGKDFYGDIYYKDFGSRDANSRELESIAYTDLGGDLEDTFKASNGEIYTIKHNGIGKYSRLNILDKDGNEIDNIQLRISDHTYNPRNNDDEARSGKFISVEIANVNATKNRFNTSYSLQFDGTDTYENVLSTVKERLNEILSTKIDYPETKGEKSKANEQTKETKAKSNQDQRPEPVGASVEGKGAEVKTKLQTAKEKLKEAKAKLDRVNAGLGISSDPKEKAKAFYDYHVALVEVAKEYISEGITTVQEFAKEIGEKVSKGIQDAWDEANGGKKKTVADFEEVSSPNEPTDAELEMLGITKKEAYRIREEQGEKQYEYDVKSRTVLVAEADRMLAEGYNVPKLIKRITNGGLASDVEVEMLRRYFASLTAAINKKPTPELLAERKSLLEALDHLKTRAGRAVQAFDGFIEVEDNLASFLQDEGQYYELSSEEVQELTEKYNKAKEALEKLQAKQDEALAKARNKKAQSKINEVKAQRRASVREDFAEERKALVEDFRAKLRQIRNTPNMVMLPYQNELIALAPFVKKMTESYVRQGVFELSEIVKGIHEEFKGDMPELTEDDVRDIIAGEYTNPRNTKNAKLAQVRDLETQARLERKIEELEAGIVSAKSQVAKKVKSDKILELERQIKEIKKRNPELTYPSRVQARKTWYANQISNLKNEIKEGKYDPVEPPTPVLLDAEALRLKDEYIAFKEQTRLRRAKKEHEALGTVQKNIRRVQQVLALRRLVQTSLDLSIPLRQGVSIMLNPRTASLGVKGYGKMVAQVFNEKEYQRMMFDIRSSDAFLESKDDGIVYTETSSSDPETRDESHPTESFLYKIPYIREPFRASERAAAAWTNYARYELYQRGVKMLLSQGKTRENAKQAYEDMAARVMVDTGRGKIPGIEDKSPSKTDTWIKRALGNTFYGARLMSSTFRKLNPFYYFNPKVDKSVRIQALKDMAGYVSTQIILGTVIAATTGATVSLDWDDPDFLKLRWGKRVIDLTAGQSTYIRTFMRLVNAAYNRANPYVSKEDAEKYSKFAKQSVETFFRNKLAPNTSYGVNAFMGENTIGEKFDPLEIVKIYPMYTEDVVKAFEEGSPLDAAIIVPIGVLGLGYQEYSRDIRRARLSTYIDSKDVKLRSFLKRHQLNITGDINQEVYNLDAGMKVKMTNEQSDRYEKIWADYVISDIKDHIPELEKLAEIDKKHEDEKGYKEKLDAKISAIKSEATKAAKEQISGVNMELLTIRANDKTYELTPAQIKERKVYYNEFIQENGRDLRDKYLEEGKSLREAEKAVRREATSVSKDRILDKYKGDEEGVYNLSLKDD